MEKTWKNMEKLWKNYGKNYGKNHGKPTNLPKKRRNYVEILGYSCLANQSVFHVEIKKYQTSKNYVEIKYEETRDWEKLIKCEAMDGDMAGGFKSAPLLDGTRPRNVARMGRNGVCFGIYPI